MPEDISLKQLATTITVLLSLGAGLGYLGSMVASQWELNRATAYLNLQQKRFEIYMYDRNICDRKNTTKDAFIICLDVQMRLAAIKEANAAMESIK